MAGGPTDAVPSARRKPIDARAQTNRFGRGRRRKLVMELFHELASEHSGERLAP